MAKTVSLVLLSTKTRVIVRQPHERAPETLRVSRFVLWVGEKKARKPCFARPAAF